MQDDAVMLQEFKKNCNSQQTLNTVYINDACRIRQASVFSGQMIDPIDDCDIWELVIWNSPQRLS